MPPMRRHFFRGRESYDPSPPITQSNNANVLLSHRSFQQNEFRQAIRATPDDGVLLEMFAEVLRFFQIQTQDQEALFTGPLVRRMLSCSGQIAQAAPGEFIQKFLLAKSVVNVWHDLTVWIACGNKCTAFHSTGLMNLQQFRDDLPDLKSERHIAMYAIFRFLICVDSGGVDDRV